MTDRDSPICFDELVQFILQLRDAGYDIGVDQFVLVEKLLLELAAQGAISDDIRQLGTWIGPILCCSPEEQRDFRLRFNNWAQERRAAHAPVPSPVDDGSEPSWEVRMRQLRWRLLGHGCILGVLLLMIFVASWNLASQAPAVFKPAPAIEPAREQAQGARDRGGAVQADPTDAAKNPDGASTQSETVRWAALLVLAAIGLVATSLILRFVLAGYLRRLDMDAPPQLARLFFGVDLPDVHGNLDEAARLLRTRRYRTATGLHVELTTEETARHGGWFAPVYDIESDIPQYLALLDETGDRDQYAARSDALIQQLVNAGIYVKRHRFRGDPRRLTLDERDRRARSIKDLTWRFADHRLWIFTESENCVDPASGEPRPWVEDVDGWDERVLFTSDSPQDWGVLEERLASAGLPTAPATEEGLRATVNSVVAESLTRLSGIGSTSPFPPRLRGQLRLALAPDPPADDEVDAWMCELRRYLGDDGFVWLAACAVYPALSWELTLFLGCSLESRSGERLFNENTLRRLVTLPWFRYGWMPDWLRMRLLSEVGFRDEQRIRTLLWKLFLNRPRGHDGKLELEVTRGEGWILARLWRVAARMWRRQKHDEPWLHDRVFVTWMGRSLAVQIPRAAWGYVVKSLNVATQFVSASKKLPSTAVHWWKSWSTSEGRKKRRQRPRLLTNAGDRRWALIAAIAALAAGWLRYCHFHYLLQDADESTFGTADWILLASLVPDVLAFGGLFRIFHQIGEPRLLRGFVLEWLAPWLMYLHHWLAMLAIWIGAWILGFVTALSGFIGVAAGVALWWVTLRVAFLGAAAAISPHTFSAASLDEGFEGEAGPFELIFILLGVVLYLAIPIGMWWLLDLPFMVLVAFGPPAALLVSLPLVLVLWTFLAPFVIGASLLAKVRRLGISAGVLAIIYIGIGVLRVKFEIEPLQAFRSFVEDRKPSLDADLDRILEELSFSVTAIAWTEAALGTCLAIFILSLLIRRTPTSD